MYKCLNEEGGEEDRGEKNKTEKNASKVQYLTHHPYSPLPLKTRENRSIDAASMSATCFSHHEERKEKIKTNCLNFHLFFFLG